MRTQIDTSRLTLRPMQMTDLARIVCLANDLRVSGNLSRMPHPYRQEDGEEWLKKQPELWAGQENYVFAIEHKIDGFMGAMGLHWMDRMTLDGSLAWELGYWLGVPYWGQGFATESGKACLDYGFNELKLDRIIAKAMPDNRASLKVMIKIGMKHKGYFHDPTDPHAFVLYELLIKDFEIEILGQKVEYKQLNYYDCLELHYKIQKDFDLYKWTYDFLKDKITITYDDVLKLDVKKLFEIYLETACR